MSARVLLVGPADQPFLELKVALEQEGFLTQTAGDGVEAIETGGRFQPHLVITETVLSGISGFELASSIWKGQAGFSAPVVFYTQSYQDEKLRLAAIDEHHALHYFVMPFQKEALLNTVVPLLARIELSNEGATESHAQVQAPGKKGRTKKAPRQPAKKKPTKPGSLARESQVLARLRADDQFTLIDRSRMKKGTWTLLESSPEIGETEHVPLAETAISLKDNPAVSVSPNTQTAESRITNGALSPEGSEIPSEPESPPSGDPASIVRDTVPDHLEGAPLSKQPASHKVLLLVGAMGLLAVIGASLALRSLSDSPKGEASKGTSDFRAPYERQMGLNRGDMEVSTALASLNQPSELGEEASEAVTRWLAKSGPSTRARGMVTLRPERGAQNSSNMELIISDISPVERQPFFTSMQHPLLSAAQMRAMGSKSFLVSLELEQSGHVKEALLVTPDPEGVFPDQILDTVRKWRFVPREEAQRGSWVKYFSFKAPQTAH